MFETNETAQASASALAAKTRRLHAIFASLALVFGTGFVAVSTLAQTAVLTQHNDNNRTGENTNETILTTSNVNVSQFGKLFALPVDGQVYAQPLYVPNVTINGAIHNVLFVATENDSVYAFDADSNTGSNAAPLWKASLVDAVHGAGPNETALNTAATIGCTDLQPEIGITSTPVIDPATNTIYVEAKSTNGTSYFHRLHALDLSTGNEKSPGPVVITATVSGTGDGSLNGQLTFDSLHQQDRDGLLLVNGTIYIGFGSHCDYAPLHGWLFGYDAATFKQTGVYVTTPNGGLGGFWMGGSGIAADSSGNIYIASGNGDFDTTHVPATETGDTVLKFGTANQILSLLDYFTPQDQQTLDTNDEDLGSGGILLLPDEPGTYPHLLVSAGKEGRVYVINRDQLTTNNSHYCSGCSNDPEIVEESASSAVGSIYGMPAYWNNTLYYWGAYTNGLLTAIPITNGLPDFAHATNGSVVINWPGPTPSISSNGTTPGTGILWAIDSSQYGSPGPGPAPAVVYAFDASNISSELWNSSQAPNSRDKAGNAVKFAKPTVVNGKVYVGTSSEVDVYGLLTVSLTATPSSASVTPGNSQNFTVNVSYQNGNSGTVTLSISGLPSGAKATFNPASLTVSGQSILTVNTSTTTPTGSYLLTITGASASNVPSTTVTLDVGASSGTPVAQINSGGGAVGSFVADEDVSGGSAATTTQTVSTSGVTNPAPEAVYQSERWGVFTYTIPNLTPGGSYEVRLHFAELTFSNAGARVFSVAINGATVLSNFDIVATAGGKDIAIVEQFAATADGNGDITIAYQRGSADYPKSSGIEIIPQGSGASPDFSVSAAPSSQSIAPGGSTTYTMTVGAIGGFSGTVGLSVSGLPAGATAGFNPSSIATSGSSTLTVNTTSSTPGGTYSLLITGTSGSTTHTASVSLSVNAPGTLQINSGGGAVGSFVADEDVSGGSAATTTQTVSTSGVTNPAPEAVYQSERWGVFTYTIPNLTPGASYQVRLHFAELAFSSAGGRLFNVAINGATVLSNFDIVATAGGKDIAIVEQFAATADGNGDITIAYQRGSADYPKSSGIEIIP